MIQRELSTKLIELFSKFPAIAILGPRQSGKTTIAKEIFPDLKYVNLEDLSVKAPNIYFWRDKLGHEIDILLTQGTDFIPVEI